jgi:hypothetical protein
VIDYDTPMRPSASDYSPAFGNYINLCPEEDVLSAIEQQSSETQKLLACVDEARGAYRYAEGKWSVKEVFGHMTDAERIMGYRAVCIARGETQSLPGFDEQEYARNAGFDAWRIGDLAEAYAVTRRSNIVTLRNLQPEAWDRRGLANNNAITVRALAYVLLGHERHHLAVLRERYLLGT